MGDVVGNVSEFLEDSMDHVNLFPQDNTSDFVDSMGVAIMSSFIQIVAGKDLVKAILKKDWEHTSGVRGIIQVCVFGYAVAFSIVSAYGFATWVIWNMTKPVLIGKVFVKLLTSLILNMVIVETFKVGVIEGVLPW